MIPCQNNVKYKCLNIDNFLSGRLAQIILYEQRKNALFANQWRPCEQNKHIINLYTINAGFTHRLDRLKPRVSDKT
jgi:hypothetical protein